MTAPAVTVIVAILLGVCAVAVQARRALRHEAAFEEQAPARPAVVTRPAAVAAPVRDYEPGINLALRDDCELLWALPARHPGLDRLGMAIHREQQKGHRGGGVS